VAALMTVNGRLWWLRCCR